MSHSIATHIEIRPNREGKQRPNIDGTRVRVQDVAMLSELQGRTPDQIVEAYPHLTLAQVHAALSYYFDHRAEIRKDLHEDQELADLVRKARGPGALERSLNSNELSEEVVSSG